MGRILEYNDYFTSVGTAPQDNDLLFFGDYTSTPSNPTTYRLKISDLNKKRNIRAADSSGLTLQTSSGSRVMLIADSGNVAVGASGPDYNLDVNANAETTIRIKSSSTTDAILRFDQSSAQRASIGYDHSATLLKFNNSSTFDSNNHLVIDTSGNVGIGLSDPDYKLEVNGNIKAQSGLPGVALIAGNREIKGVNGTANNELHLNRDSGGKIWFMRYETDGTTANPVMYLDNTKRTVQIGNVSATIVDDPAVYIPKVWITHSYDGTNAVPVLRLENYYASGGHVSSLNIKTTGTSLERQYYLNVDSGNLFNIGTSLAAASTSSVNINSGGNLGLGVSSSLTRKLNVASSTNFPVDISSSNDEGTRLLIRNTAASDTSDTGLNQSSLIAFPNRVGAQNEIVNWIAGCFMRGSTSYYGIHYSGNPTATESNIAFNGTLDENLIYVNTDGDIRAKRDVNAGQNVIATSNVQGDAFYDKDGTTAGNYCRGRFLQMFSVPFYATTNGPVYPLFASPFTAAGTFNSGSPDNETVSDVAIPLGYNNSSDKTPTAEFFSVAPFAGRIQKVTVSAKNNQPEAINLNVLIWSGPRNSEADRAGLPTSSDNCGLDTTNSSYLTDQISLAGDADGDTNQNNATKGFSDFNDTNDNLAFDAGDWLAFAVDTNSGSGQGVITFAVEFLVTD